MTARARRTPQHFLFFLSLDDGRTPVHRSVLEYCFKHQNTTHSLAGISQKSRTLAPAVGASSNSYWAHNFSSICLVKELAVQSSDSFILLKLSGKN